ncbi:PH domain-containing protein [Rhodococcus sp. ARC_M6]|nr:PH domain-containing protein [Rhodococcus sp. ARC_M6]MCJ0904653.1 PH domain-containing protein [Rhodococcus sp. ARC_M6]
MVDIPAESESAAAEAAEQEQPWLRLDRRMLLVHPVNEVVKLLPVLVVSFILGSQSGNHLWGIGVVTLLVIFGLLRWFTTTYRIGPVHVQLRTGVFQKKLLSVPRSRIRSVDVEAGVMHRLLGLSIVRIGTGQRAGKGHESNKFELNALSSALIPDLRAALLAGAQGKPERPGQPTSETPLTQESSETEIGHWQPSWVRYAPFSFTGIFIIAAIVGIAFQYGVGSAIAQSSAVSNSVDSLESLGITVLVIVALVALLVLSSIFACVQYLIAFGNMTLTDNGRILHVSHGLLKTRQTTLDRARLRGTTLKEPLLLRLAGGARLDAIMTGVSAEKKESSLLLPQGPRAEAERVMATVIGDTRQASVALVGHGSAARRRRYTRGLFASGIALVALLACLTFGVQVPVYAWVVVAVLAVGGAALAYDRATGLGHAVLPGWLITRSGSLDRKRHSLEADGVIGWTVRETFFQRRAGVATVIAATPAGTGGYAVIDLPAQDSWSLIEAVTPGAGDVWADRR